MFYICSVNRYDENPDQTPDERGANALDDPAPYRPAANGPGHDPPYIFDISETVKYGDLR